MTLDLLTIGDSSIDLYMKIDEATKGVAGGTTEFPKICFFHGSKINASQSKTFAGGNACNVAAGASKLGLVAGIYTEIGDDENSQKLLIELKNKNVDTTFVIQGKDSPTDVHTILVYKQERTIITHHEKHQYKLQEWQEPKWVYYTSVGRGFELFQKELVRYLKTHSKTGVAFNPGTIQMEEGLDNLKNFLEVTDILFINKEEAKRLVGDGTMDRTHIKLQALGPKLTVITDGKNGSSAFEGKSFYEQDCIPSATLPVDKTGAGDAFASGFLSAIFYGKSIKEALLWGSLNAAGEITQIGVGTGLLSKKEIEKLAKSYLSKPSR